MGLRTIVTMVREDTELFNYLKNISLLANNLYNATLFRMRQILTAANKDQGRWTDNEKGVQVEIDRLLEVNSNLRRPTRENPYVSYPFVHHLMYVNRNPDYFCDGLPSQTGQQVMKNAVQNMKAFYKAKADWRKHPKRRAEDLLFYKPASPDLRRRDPFSVYGYHGEEAEKCQGWMDSETGKRRTKPQRDLIAVRIRRPSAIQGAERAEPYRIDRSGHQKFRSYDEQHRPAGDLVQGRMAEAYQLLVQSEDVKCQVVADGRYDETVPFHRKVKSVGDQTRKQDERLYAQSREDHHQIL